MPLLIVAKWYWRHVSYVIQDSLYVECCLRWFFTCVLLQCQHTEEYSCSLRPFCSHFFIHVTVDVLFEYMATCLCLSGTFIPSCTIHPKSNVAIYKSQIDNMPFWFFCVISDSFTSRFHYCIPTMGSRSYVRPINTHPQHSLDASMNSMYDGSIGISFVHFFVSVDASCSICCILPTDYLTAVNFTRFTHDGYRPSTELNGINSPFASGIPIVAWKFLLGLVIFFMFFWC